MFVWVSACAWAAALIGGIGWALAQEKPPDTPDTEDGQLAFNNRCRTCHTAKDGDNRLGPSLHKVVGRKSGSVPGYGYSGAMRDADIVWDKVTLDRFIADPDAVVRGNSMRPYSGIPAAETRARIIAYLEKSGSN
jgi:cytochrome c